MRRNLHDFDAFVVIHTIIARLIEWPKRFSTDRIQILTLAIFYKKFANMRFRLGADYFSDCLRMFQCIRNFQSLNERLAITLKFCPNLRKPNIANAVSSFVQR